MRRSFLLRVAFAPTRLSAEHLREAYEAVTPVLERTIESANVGTNDTTASSSDQKQRSRRVRSR
jgi:hypothetical protein